jgi:ABC-type nitrate/sulfonate/bicarbonate transport system substrate-binding protein
MEASVSVRRLLRDAGLDVTIREGGPGIDVAEIVASRKADFGACSANVIFDNRE